MSTSIPDIISENEMIFLFVGFDILRPSIGSNNANLKYSCLKLPHAIPSVHTSHASVPYVTG